MKKYLPLIVYLLIICSAVNCGKRDELYIKDFRPIVVLFYEEVKGINDISKGEHDIASYGDKFARFSDNVEAIRKKAILVEPPKTKDMKLFNEDFISMLEKSKFFGEYMSINFLNIDFSTMEICFGKDKEKKENARKQVIEWVEKANFLQTEINTINKKNEKSIAVSFKTAYYSLDVGNVINEYDKWLKAYFK